MSGRRFHKNLSRTGIAAFVLVLFTQLLPVSFNGTFAEEAVSPDTPVSSDGAVSPGISDSGSSGSSPPSVGTGALNNSSDSASDNSSINNASGAVSPASAGAEIGSQVSSQVKTVKTTVSYEQEKRDRLFVDATFIAVSLILCVIAFLLFMSLPKQSKKTGNDNVQ
jgi:hypothetical protein